MIPLDIYQSLMDELEKVGTISEEQARRALDQYEGLEASKPTLGQVGRYAALGAVAAPAVGALGDVVYGAPVFGGKIGRGIASSAVKGALGSGAIPLVRQQWDRHVAKSTLREYLRQYGIEPGQGRVTPPLEPTPEQTINPQEKIGKVLPPKAGKEKDSQMSGVTPAVHWSGDAPVSMAKAGFATSAYDAGMSPPRFPMVSQLPAFRGANLRRVRQDQPQQIVEKLGSTAVTPEGRLHSTMRVGLPKVTAPSGPSVAQVAKPDGYGKPLSGAKKTTI
jgi:hypothetical protein